MEETIDGKYFRGKSLLPCGDLDEQFRDWVNWLQSAGALFGGSQASRVSPRQVDPATPSFDPGLLWESGWGWRDIGGESGEAV